MSVSFNGCNEQIVTFKAAGGLVPGVPVKVSENDTVSPCTAGDVFCGVCKGVRNGYASVQISGFVKLGYSGSTIPSVGYCTLASDGDGGVEVVSSGGKSYLTTSVDATDNFVGIMI